MKINLLGSGYMGKQICSLFVILGYDVVIWQNSTENLDDLYRGVVPQTKFQQAIINRQLGQAGLGAGLSAAAGR